MDLAQWAYWATAVPVTLLVLVLGLWFTGELGALGRWVAAGFGFGSGLGGLGGVWGFGRGSGGGGRGGYVEGAGGKGDVVVVGYDEGWEGDGEGRGVGRSGGRAWREVRKRRRVG
jgi:hypothetical protein